MIKDKIENAHFYYNLSSNIQKGFEWLKSQDPESIKPGRYYIDDKNLYANVDEYETKEDAKYEAHRDYIDIQYLIKGKELIGVTDISNGKTCIEYDKEKDIEFFDAEDEFQTLNVGEFFIFFPQDAHKPCITYNEKVHCKKIVVKVKI